MKRLLVIALCILLLGGCGVTERINQAAQNVEPVDEAVYTLSDGTVLSLWKDKQSPELGMDTYKLPDGVKLLEVGHAGVYDAWAGYQVYWDTMSESAQTAVLDWFAARGKRLTTDGALSELLGAVLEGAYADYLQCQKENKDFRPWYLSEETYHVASNPNILVFDTTIHVVEGTGMYAGWFAASLMEEYGGAYLNLTHTAQIFRCDDGAYVAPAELFVVPEDEAAEQLRKRCGLEQVIIDSVVPEENGLYVWCPPVVASDESGYSVVVPYADVVDLLHPWVPGLDDGV